MRLGRYFFIGIFILLGFTAFSFTSYGYQFESFAQVEPPLTSYPLDPFFVPVNSATDGEEFDVLDGARDITVVTIGSSVYAIIASTVDNGIQIIDITDPKNIVAVSSAVDEEDGFDKLAGARSITTATIGSSVYALVASAFDDGVQIIDITDPKNILPVDSATDEGGGFNVLKTVTGITTVKIGSSTYALVASFGDDGVQIIDITDPENIVAVSSAVDGKNKFKELDGAFQITTVTIGSSIYALVASTTDDGVQIIDITDPKNILPVDSATDEKEGFKELDGAAGITTVKIGSSFYALVASFDDDGIQIIDITDPENILPVDSATNGRDGFDKLGGAHRITTVALRSSFYALVTSDDDDSVQIIDITDPENIIPVDSATDGIHGFDELDGATGITTVKIGSTTYVLTASYDDDGIQIIEIKEPKGYNLKIFDSLGISDSVKASVNKSVSISDGLGINDSVKASVNKSVSISDGLGINDSVSVTKMKYIPEPVQYSLELSDSVGISDSVSVTKMEFIPEPVQYSLELSDSIGISDSVSVTKLEFVPEPVQYSLELSDSVGISDLVEVTKIEFVPEPVQYSLELSDSIGIRDSVSVTKLEFVPEPVQYSLELSDSVGISDSVSVTKMEFVPEPVQYSLKLSDRCRD